MGETVTEAVAECAGDGEAEIVVATAVGWAVGEGDEHPVTVVTNERIAMAGHLVCPDFTRQL